MFGARFLDADFMRINLTCASPTVYVTRFFCIVVKGRAAACTVIAIRMEAPERARSIATRAARPTSFLSCRRTSVWDPRGGGTFWFQIFIRAPALEIWSETISGCEEVLAGKWGGLFLGYLLGKNFWRRDRDRLVPPGRTDAAVCRAEVCYPFGGTTGGIVQ